LQRALETDGTGEEGDENWDAEIVMMAVLPSHQGKGVGKALMTELLRQYDELIDKGRDRINGVGTQTSSVNPAANHRQHVIVLSTQRKVNLQFYSNFGFVEVPRSHTAPRPFESWSMVRRH
jgi:GNAT superfamily N-acetyltransferase